MIKNSSSLPDATDGNVWILLPQCKCVSITSVCGETSGRACLVIYVFLFLYMNVCSLSLKSAGDNAIMKSNLVSSNACMSMRLYGINAPRLDLMLTIICWHQLIKCGGAGEVIQRHIPSSSFWLMLITHHCTAL